MILRIFWITHRNEHADRNTYIFKRHGVPGYPTASQLINKIVYGNHVQSEIGAAISSFSPG